MSRNYGSPIGGDGPMKAEQLFDEQVVERRPGQRHDGARLPWVNCRMLLDGPLHCDATTIVRSGPASRTGEQWFDEGDAAFPSIWHQSDSPKDAPTGREFIRAALGARYASIRRNISIRARIQSGESWISIFKTELSADQIIASRFARECADRVDRAILGKSIQQIIVDDIQRVRKGGSK
jgi:hypothetical protein